jgi:CBS domain-containing protein
MGLLSGKALRDIMTSEVESIRPDAPLREAAEKMKRLDVGVLPVCTGRHLEGIITDRDITIRAVADGCDPMRTRVGEIMTGECVTCHPETSISDAANLMKEKQIRRLLIVDQNDELCGIVSLGDMAVDYGHDKLTGSVLKDVSEPSEPRK